MYPTIRATRIGTAAPEMSPKFYRCERCGGERQRNYKRPTLICSDCRQTDGAFWEANR